MLFGKLKKNALKIHMRLYSERQHNVGVQFQFVDKALLLRESLPSTVLLILGQF